MAQVNGNSNLNSYIPHVLLVILVGILGWFLVNLANAPLLYMTKAEHKQDITELRNEHLLAMALIREDMKGIKGTMDEINLYLRKAKD